MRERTNDKQYRSTRSGPQVSPAPVPDWLGSIARIRLIELPRYAREDGEIVVAQAFNQVAVRRWRECSR